MSADTLPSSLVLRLVADLLDCRIRRLREQVEHNPRRTSPGKIAGRQAMLAHLHEQVAAIRSLHAAGEVNAAVAGLLLAWAGDYGEAVAALEERFPALVEVPGDDWARACRVILGAR